MSLMTPYVAEEGGVRKGASALLTMPSGGSVRSSLIDLQPDSDPESTSIQPRRNPSSSATRRCSLPAIRARTRAKGSGSLSSRFSIAIMLRSLEWVGWGSARPSS
jgi:hypothetical protein